jgi:hypothetical protein
MLQIRDLLRLVEADEEFLLLLFLIKIGRQHFRRIQGQAQILAAGAVSRHGIQADLDQMPASVV